MIPFALMEPPIAEKVLIIPATAKKIKMSGIPFIEVDFCEVPI